MNCAEITIGIIGAGTMGRGIAQVAATVGHPVLIFEKNPTVAENSQSWLRNILSRQVEKARMTEKEVERTLNNIRYVDALEHFEACDLVIEAIVEKLSVKQAVFQELETYVEPKTIIASNTSSLSITALASALKQPQRFVGIHFFNPPALMKLVEIIPAIQTNEKTKNLACEWIRSWAKTVVLAKDTPGFIVNRVARPFYGEALRVFDEGIADAPAIDWSVKTFGGFKMGPFELMDYIGNDVNYTVTETVFQAFFNDERYRPSFTQKRMVEAGYLGRKTQKGFYDYTALKTEKEHQSFNGRQGKLIFNRILIMLINEAADALYYRIADKEAIDLAMTMGVNYPKGLLKWADEWGIQTCVNKMDELFEMYHEPRYRCSPLLRKMSQDNETFYPRI